MNITKKPVGIVLHMWIKDNLKVTIDEVLCIQLDHVKYKVYIKLISKAKVDEVLNRCINGLYYDEDGERKEIYIKEELQETAVRIYDFPIELNNNKIVSKLSRYGIVRSIRNEKWNEAEGLFPVKSGIRTVIMVIEKNIPSYLQVENYVSLVTYHQQIRTCLFCNEPGHVRAECPKRPANRIMEIRRPPVPIVQEEVQEDQFTVLRSANKERSGSENEDTQAALESKNSKRKITDVTPTTLPEEERSQLTVPPLKDKAPAKEN